MRLGFIRERKVIRYLECSETGWACCGARWAVGCLCERGLNNRSLSRQTAAGFGNDNGLCSVTERRKTKNQKQKRKTKSEQQITRPTHGGQAHSHICKIPTRKSDVCGTRMTRYFK